MNGQRKTNLRVLTATLLAVALAGAALLAQGVAYYTKVRLANTCWVQTGAGTPEGAVVGSICDLFLRTDGGSGSTLYVKEAGAANNTGWQPVVPGTVAVTSGGTGLTAYTTGDILYASGATTLAKLAVTNGYLLKGTATGPAYVRDVGSQYIGAARCQGASATANFNLPNAVTAAGAECYGANLSYGVLSYPDASNHLAFVVFHLPDSWDSTGAVKLELHWFTAATAGDAIWSVQTACGGVGETMDPVLNAAQTVTTATNGTANYRNISAIASLTMTGCVAGESLAIQVSRDGSVAGDTIADAAKLASAELTWYQTR